MSLGFSLEARGWQDHAVRDIKAKGRSSGFIPGKGKGVTNFE